MVARSYHHGELRESLIASALAALERDGELPSWRALARDCKVSQSAPYRHFESVHDLRIEVIAAGFNQLTAAINAALAPLSDPFERLSAGNTAYMRFGIEHSALYGLMFSGNGHLRDGKAGIAGGESFRTLIAALVACGVKSPSSTAFVIWTAMHGLVDIVRAGGEAPGKPKTVEGMIAGTLQLINSYVEDAIARQAAPEPDKKSRR